ncbi:MAG TPA: hypothetical protein VGI60_09380 [Chthoniobacterales bacterium]
MKDKGIDPFHPSLVRTPRNPSIVGKVRHTYRSDQDKMMTKFKASAPDFYSAYLAARVIVTRPCDAEEEGTAASAPPPAPTP